ncbi:MAG: VWA domain-containing protein [Ferruginibacter sp.]
MKCLSFFLFAFCFMFQLKAQNNQNPSPIIFIYDASGSMWGKIQGKTKKDIAAEVLTAAVNKLPANQKTGLVAYGHRQKDDCKDVEFLVDVEKGNKTDVNNSLKTIKSLGRTPLAYSAQQVIDKLRTTKMKATIILITDGIESCGGNICDVIAAAKKEGIDFKLHIVGFGLKENETEQLKCAAKAGDGRYYDAADAGGLGDVLNDATTESVDKPKGNISVYALKNGKPIDAYVKAIMKGKKRGDAVARTYRDTVLFYLQPGTYNLEVLPLEGSKINPLTLTDVLTVDKKITHRTVSFDGGKLTFTTTNNNEGWDCLVKIYKKGTKTVAATGRTYGRDKDFELNAGIYDIELTALVIEGTEIIHSMKNVEIKAAETNKISHNFNSGVAMIGAKTGSGYVDASVKITEIKSKKIVAYGRTYMAASSNPKKFLLNPGTYEVSLTGLGANKGKNDKYIITVKAGETVEKISNL